MMLDMCDKVRDKLIVFKMRKEGAEKVTSMRTIGMHIHRDLNK
jgi:hypothetical protein